MQLSDVRLANNLTIRKSFSKSEKLDYVPWLKIDKRQSKVKCKFHNVLKWLIFSQSNQRGAKWWKYA